MKKIYSLLTLLVFTLAAGFGTVAAQDATAVTVELNADNGSWTRSNANGTWHAQWTSTEAPQTQLTHAANNMNYYDGQNLQLFTVLGGATPQTYTLSVDEAYYIESISLEFKSSDDTGVSVSIYGGIPVETYDTEEYVSVESIPELAEDQLSSVEIVVAKLGSTNNFVQTRNFIVTLKTRDQYDVVRNQLDATYTQYYQYRDAVELNIGTEPGNYDEQAAQAFLSALNAYTILLDPFSDTPTIEQMNELIKLIQDTYQAVIDSTIPYTFADGFYRLRAGMDYYEDIEVVGEDGESGTERVYPAKYMYVTISKTGIAAKWGTPANVATDCTALWRIENRNGLADIVSAAADARFNLVSTSAAVTLSAESDSLMAIEPATTIDGVTYVNIRLAAQQHGGYIYLHQGSHSGGAGKGGNVVGWNPTYADGVLGASEWVLEPVSEDEAMAIIEAYEPIKNHEAMVEDYKTILAAAKTELAIARDLSADLDTEQPLISDVSQLSSPYTEGTEGSIDALIDGDASTYWHSSWQAGNVANGTHYLQVELVGASVEQAAFQFTRRAVTNDHITAWEIYGTNEAEADKAECELLAEVLTPFTSNTETIISEAFPVGGYSYLRFYINGTTTGRGYGHMSEFQLYPATVIDPATSQYHVMGEIAKALESVIAEQKGVVADDVTVEQYTALRDAYEPFAAVFVNPAELRAAIADAEQLAESGIVVGDAPGQWTDANAAQPFAAVLAQAKEYDTAGAYTAERSAELIEAIGQTRDEFLAAANGIEEGKWYRFRFAPRDMFDEFGWDPVAGNAAGASPELFGKYVTAYDVTQEGDELLFIELEPDQLVLGSNCLLIDQDEVFNPDLAMFRFVAVADTAYMIQNKATGLFLRAAGTSGTVTLSAHPSLFNTRAIGYGLSVMPARSITGDAQSYLHAQVSYNVLVTWNVDYPGSRSGFIIEEAEDVDAGYEGTDFTMSIRYGAVNTFCFPVEIAANEGQIYTVNNDGVSENTITLVPVDKVQAGRPFIYINGQTTDYIEGEDAEPVSFAHGYTIDAVEPDTAHLLKGTYAAMSIQRGVICARGNALVVNKDNSTTIPANSAYIADGKPYETTATYSIVIDVNGEDGINAALANVSRGGELYTVEGRLISRRATLNDLRALGRGVYILGGTKVMVR